MPTRLLTDRGVAGLKAATRRAIYFDTKTTGLALRVGARRKTWCFVYRHNGGPLQWLKLGTYPALSLADARTQALDARHALDVEKVDPAEARRPPAPAPATPPPFTFAMFVPVFVAFQKGRKDTWKDDDNMITRHLLAPWGALPLKDITRRHVHELLDGVVAKGLTVGVNRVQALISRIFTVALDRSLIDAHPAARLIKRFNETPGEKTLTDEELRALWRDLDARPGPAADVTKLRALLGQRGGQTASMRRAEIDLDQKTWTKARRAMKRKKGGGPHVVALPPLAFAIVERHLKALPDTEPRVFPGFHLKGDEMKALAPLTGDAYTWIDLRRTVATRLAELGFDEGVIDRVLDHARTSVTKKHYDKHEYVEEIRQALTAWDTEFQRILANAPKKRSRVLPMRRSR